MINAEDHIGLVYLVSSRYKKSILEYDDVVGYGMIGLVKAAKKFDKRLGYTFSTYAVPLIRGEILKAIRDKSGLIGSRKDKQEGKASVALPFSVLMLEKEEDKDISFEIPIGDTFVDEIIENLDIRQAMNKLSDIEKKVLFKKYWEEKTQSMTADELGVSQAEISRKLRRALDSISSYINVGGIAN